MPSTTTKITDTIQHYVDTQGTVRIWDATQPEQILKTEVRALSGRINDLAWDFESKRIIAVGEGKDRFGHSFFFDSASSVGEISGHSKAINSVSLRPGRPFRAVTASDDLTVNFYHGVPFKFNKSMNNHSRFVQCVRYSPSGDHFASCGMDSKIFLYDGKTGDLIAELSQAENGHTGGVTSIDWSPDGTSLLSCSSDTTAKIWDIQSQKVVKTYTFGEKLGAVDDQQVGCLWQQNHIVSLSLSGVFNYLEKDGGPKPARVVDGHQKAITALAVVPASKTFYTGSYEGRIYSWNDDSGTQGGKQVEGSGHTNQVVRLAPAGTQLYSAGLDDTVRVIDSSTNSFKNIVRPTGSLPVDVATGHDNSMLLVTNDGNIELTKKDTTIAKIKVDYTPTVASVSPTNDVVVIGSEDRKVYVYKLENSTLKLHQTLEGNRGSIASLSFSPNGQLLASADRERMILVYDTSSWKVTIDKWLFHNARINSIRWSPDSLYAASGSLDTNLEIWSTVKPTKHICVKGAHQEGVNAVDFLAEGKVVSVGQDAMIK
ncbi:hypothetical protein HDV05_003479, partial [Chytridiales sp. JEL 0842]